ncbi:cellulose binding domain-containing protein [Plantactinospora sp. B5E13]|uniref:cellulose binding domain-containing protein n=1 Tax=unclassified Plantactinospora TaxID=2631981 RepID=UPI00325CD0A7
MEQRPSRTLPVVVLDLLLTGVAAVRGLARRTVRLPAGRRGDRALAVVIVAAALAVVTGTGFVVAALLRAPDQLAPLGVAAPPSPTPEAGGDDGRTPGEASGTPPASSPLPPPPSRAPNPPADTDADPGPPPPPPAALLGSYTTEDVTLLHYTASVTITNPGRSAAGDWTLVLTLPRQTQSIGLVDGAKVSRDGATWTFVPDQETRRVPAGGSVRVRFRVDGAVLDAAPTGCAVNGRPCAQPSKPADR